MSALSLSCVTSLAVRSPSSRDVPVSGGVKTRAGSAFLGLRLLDRGWQMSRYGWPSASGHARPPGPEAPTGGRGRRGFRLLLLGSHGDLGLGEERR